MIYKENVYSKLKMYISSSIENSMCVEALTKKYFFDKKLLIRDHESLKELIYTSFDFINDDSNINHLLFDRFGSIWNKMLSIKDIETFELLLAISIAIGAITIDKTERVQFISGIGKEPVTKNKQCLTDENQREIREYLDKYVSSLYRGFHVRINREEALKYNPVDIMTHEDLVEYVNDNLFKTDVNHSLNTIEAAGKILDKYPEELFGLICILLSNGRKLDEILDYIDNGTIDRKIADVVRLCQNPSIAMKLDRLKRKEAYSYKMKQKSEKESEEIKRHL